MSWEGEGAPFKEDDESITHHVSHLACGLIFYFISPKVLVDRS